VSENYWRGTANYFQGYEAVEGEDGWHYPADPGDPWGSLLGQQGAFHPPAVPVAAYGYYRQLRFGWNCCEGSQDKKTQYEYIGRSTTVVP
jgi:hypothetical protein